MGKRTEPEWQELVEQYQSSGLRQEQWCKQHGINLYTFRDRLSKLKKAAIPATPETQQVCETAQAPETESIRWLQITQNITESTHPAGLEVTIGGFTILVPHGFNTETFSEICKALMSLC